MQPEIVFVCKLCAELIECTIYSAVQHEELADLQR